jgi:hypothetical protein
MHFSFLESAAARLDGISRTGTAAYIGPKQHCNYLAGESKSLICGKYLLALG